jgi:hypothetical protein
MLTAGDAYIEIDNTNYGTNLPSLSCPCSSFCARCADLTTNPNPTVLSTADQIWVERPAVQVRP